MHPKSRITSRSQSLSQPVALYNSSQVYAIEQAWFAQGYSSFALMQQAAWQMTQGIIQLNADNRNYQHLHAHDNIYYAKNKHLAHRASKPPRASIWVGVGNNGGDGWLIAYYLQQAGWQVQVIVVGDDSRIDIKGISATTNNAMGEDNIACLSDAKKAAQIAKVAHCPYHCFESRYFKAEHFKAKCFKADHSHVLTANVYIDAIFGIGLNRLPTGIYQQAINTLNAVAQQAAALVIAVDVPSGLVASTGQVFEGIAIKADVTFCLIARKFGLHTKDGMDYAGEVIDIPLIPFAALAPTATLLNTAYPLSARRHNSYKGSYGHVLVIGGNRIDGSQGMGGAAILAASSAMATGAGKITVACHEAFHGALLTSLPDAMTIDLHQVDSVKTLIKDANVIAIGMGLGRDKMAQTLFVTYITAAMTQHKSMVIDADGLYHLATLHATGNALVAKLRAYSTDNRVYLTPHSGEAAYLLNKKIEDIEADRLTAIQHCADDYGGDWVLKGAGSLVLEQASDQRSVYVCAVGNAGMATAGMGDVLSGLAAGLLAQQDLKGESSSLRQAVLIHGQAGDVLLDQRNSSNDSPLLFIGQRGLQAQDMPAAIRHVIHMMSV